MKKFFDAGVAGFVLGVVLGGAVAVSILESYDLPVEHIDAARRVCAYANSELVSTDWHHATCASEARIPYRVTK